MAAAATVATIVGLMVLAGGLAVVGSLAAVSGVGVWAAGRGRNVVCCCCWPEECFCAVTVTWDKLECWLIRKPSYLSLGCCVEILLWL